MMAAALSLGMLHAHVGHSASLIVLRPFFLFVVVVVCPNYANNFIPLLVEKKKEKRSVVAFL